MSGLAFYLIIASAGAAKVPVYDSYGFALCNYTGETVSLAMAGVDKSDNQYKVRGWWVVQDGKCSPDMTLAKREVAFLAASDSRPDGLGGDVPICVPNQAFERTDNREASCGKSERVVKFSRTSSMSPNWHYILEGIPHPGPLTASPTPAANEDQLAYDRCAALWNGRNWGRDTSPRALAVGTRSATDGQCFVQTAGPDSNDFWMGHEAKDACTKAGFANCRVFTYGTNVSPWVAQQERLIQTGGRTPPPPPQPAYYGFSLCNYSGEQVDVALAGVERDGVDRVRAWWQVKDGECRQNIMTYADPHIALLTRLPSGAFAYNGPTEICLADTVYERIRKPNYTCGNNEHVEKFVNVVSGGPDWTYTINAMAYDQPPPASPTGAATEDQLAYDQCKSLWDSQNWSARTDTRVLVAGTRANGDGSFHGGCYYAWAGGTPSGMAEIRQLGIASCTKGGFTNCRLFAYNNRVTSWAYAQARAIAEGRRNPAPPPQPVASNSSNDDDDDDFDLLSIAKTVVGGAGMVVGTLTGKQDLAMQGAQMVDDANGNGGGGGGGSGYTPIPSSGGAGQDCLPDLRRARLAMLQKANECKLDSSQIGTLGSGGTVIPANACNQPLSGFDQKAAYDKCSRIYGCGIQATSCAIAKVQAGGECKAAVAACMQQFPVPQ